MAAYCLLKKIPPKNQTFLLICNSSSVSCRTCYIMCPWKIYPRWNCLNSRSSADVRGTGSAKGDLDWCGIWREGNASLLSVRKLSVKCCHCIKMCVYVCVFVCLVCVCVCVRVCPCIIGSAYMPHSAGGAGHVSSWQKLLQQTETNSWIWVSAENVCMCARLNSVATTRKPLLSHRFIHRIAF